jgi:hypothetical protein
MPPWVGALGLTGGLLPSLQNTLKTGHSGALGGGGAWGIPQPQPLQAMPPWVGAFGEPGEKSGCVSFN